MADSQLGLVVPQHRLVEGPHRLFLEVERFDRSGAGRRGVVSLLGLDSHVVGNLTKWSGSALRLRDRRLISADDMQRIADLEAFGRLIGNTDMHRGNLSFFRDGWPATASFRLAPVYDQLPMLYAPIAGEIIERQLGDTVLTPAAEALANFGRTVELAARFWDRVAGHPRISPQFRTIASANGQLVRSLMRARAGKPALRA